MILEVFKDIQGYEGWYQVSNHGRVRSVDRIVTYNNGNAVKYSSQILSQFMKKNGYLQTTLYKNHNKKKFYTHRLVAFAFIPNDDSENKIEINHIDENKQNNDVNNLEWVTSSQNKRHNDLHIRVSKYTDYAKGAKKRKIPIIATSVETGEDIHFDSATDAERLMGFSHGHIAAVCRGKLKAHKGYRFRYAN
jgi:hypothetical protein